MKKLMKSQETLTVQAGTNGSSCYCYVSCIDLRNYYKDLQRDTTNTGGNNPFSLSETE